MKKLYYLLLAVGLLVIVAYLVLRVWLQKDVNAANPATPVAATPAHTTTLDSTLDLRPLLIAKIQQLVQEGSKGLYHIHINDVEIDVIQSKVWLQKVKLTPDTAALQALNNRKEAPDDVFKASFNTLLLEGINVDDVVTSKTIDLKTVYIKGPVIEVYHQKRAYNGNKKEDPMTLYQRLLAQVDRIKVGSIKIEDGTFISHNLDSRKKATRLNHVNIAFTDILIDSATQHDKDRFLFAKRADITLRDYAVKTSDNLYLFKAGTISIQAPQHNLTASNVSLISRYNEQDFQKKLKTMKEQYTVRLPALTLRNVNWWRLMHEEALAADVLQIRNPQVKVSLDRSLPAPPSKMGGFPHQLLMKLPIQVAVKKLQVHNMKLAYKEYNPLSEKEGTLYFDNINMTVSNVTNQPDLIQKNRYATIHATARFMKQVPLQSTFKLDLARHKQGAFTADINLGAFEGNLINPVALPLGLFEIKKGNVKSAKVQVKGNENNATGKVLLLYNDLKLSLYKKDEDKEEGLDKRSLVSLLGNTFVIKDDNPKKDDAPRHPEAAFTRDQQAGFFNLIWKTTLTGILESVGANPKIAQKK